MNETPPENPQQAANRHHARQTKTQRIRFVHITMTIDDHARHVLDPTTSRDRIRVLPDTSPYLAQRR